MQREKRKACMHRKESRKTPKHPRKQTDKGETRWWLYTKRKWTEHISLRTSSITRLAASPPTKHALLPQFGVLAELIFSTILANMLRVGTIFWLQPHMFLVARNVLTKRGRQ